MESVCDKMEQFDFESIGLDIEKTRLKARNNNIYLSDNQIEILKRYNIDYQKYNSISSLLFDIEEILNSGMGEDDLEILSNDIQEFNYYNNTNK